MIKQRALWEHPKQNTIEVGSLLLSTQAWAQVEYRTFNTGKNEANERSEMTTVWRSTLEQRWKLARSPLIPAASVLIIFPDVG